jgi:serine/threonine-protein kinase
MQPTGWDPSQFVRAVLIDLGIASDPRGTDAPADDGTEGVTGTPGYIAPESAQGLSLVSPAIDVYALSVVAFEALTGRNPFLEGDPEFHTVLIRHGTMPLPLEELPDEAQTPALLHLLAEAGKLDPQARPSMLEFVERWIEATHTRD